MVFNLRTSSFSSTDGDDPTPPRSFSSPDEDDPTPPRSFSLKELRDVTNHFSHGNIMGRGDFGTTYRGRLADGSLVAVKRATVIDRAREEIFERETQGASSVSLHPNVLYLRGFCREKGELLLVYPLKSKGGEGENKKKEGEDGFTVVLKMDMHCGVCAEKIVKWAKSVEGVEKAKADWKANKLTVRGKMDPWELREELEGRIRKKVEVVSPQLPKKDNDKDKYQDSKSSASSDNDNKAKDKKAEDKKPKEPPVSTAVLKLELHCAGCIDKIYKTATKVKGVQNIQFDKEKDLVAVTGTMDAKALMESLKEKMKRPVEVVQPKKDKDGGGGGGGEGGGKKNKKGGGNAGKEGGDGD